MKMSVPHQINIPASWRGSYMKENPDLWLYELNAAEINELENAASKFILSNIG